METELELSKPIIDMAEASLGPKFNPNGFRHMVSDKLLPIKCRDGVIIIKRWLHNQPISEKCYKGSKQGPHFHYLVNIAQNLIDESKVTKKAIVTHAKVLYGNYSAESVNKYCETYEVIPSNFEKKAKRNDTANNYESLSESEDQTDNLTQLAIQQSPRETIMDTLRKLEFRNEELYLELQKIFPNKKDSYKQLMSNYVGITSREFLTKQYKLYKQYLNAKMEAEKEKPLTQEDKDLTNLDEQHKLVKEEIYALLLSIYRMKEEKNKTPIVFMCGVPSSGKSFYQQVIGNVLGSPLDYQDTQLVGDMLVMDTAMKRQHDIMMFEEFSLRNFKNNELSKAFQTLKSFTSGRERYYRESKSIKATDGKLDISAILICTNESASSILQTCRADDGIMERLVLFEFKTPIPVENRWNREYIDKIIVTFIKMGKYHYQTFKEGWFCLIPNRHIDVTEEERKRTEWLKSIENAKFD